MSEIPDDNADTLRPPITGTSRGEPALEPAKGKPPRLAPFYPDLTWLFMVIAGGITSALIIQHPGLDYCPNDASRWTTVYMLVEHGTYEYKLDHGAKFREGEKFRRDADVSSLTPQEIEQQIQDEKLIRITDGPLTKYYRPTVSGQSGELIYFPLFPTIDMVKRGDKYYSSKPPLLPTILAGVAWCVERVAQVDFRTNPWVVIRATLIITQVLPLMLFIWLVGRYARRVTDSPWAHSATVAVAALGTYLTPWTVTLNNHVLAAFTGMIALYALTRIWYDGSRSWRHFVLAGFFATLTAALELPAAALAAAVLLGLFFMSPRRTLAYALLPALIPVVAFFITNHAATGHYKIMYAEFGQPGGGYDYVGSYWRNPKGLDALHEPAPVYLMNITVGHHGFFSLMPILAIAFLGMGAQLAYRSYSRPLLALFVPVATGVVICFYTFKTIESKNYGGTAQGPRWLFWLIPLWITMLAPGLHLMSKSRVSRAICYVLLLASALSVGFAYRQPWGASWFHLLMRACGKIDY